MNKWIIAAACAINAIATAAITADPLATPARMSPLAPASLLTALAPAGARLVAAGERGIVVYSDTHGAKWEQATVPVSVTLTSLHFPDALHGWAVGHDGAVLATQDAGKSWSRQFDGVALGAMTLATARATRERARTAASAKPADKAAHDALAAADNVLGDIEAGLKFGPSRPLLSVWFKDALTGYAVGAFGHAIRTVDGGAHWQDMQPAISNPDGLHLNFIAGDGNGGLLMAGEGGRVYRSTDAGASWSTLATGYAGQLYGALATGDGALLAYGFGGTVLRSDDGGKHWKTLAPLIRKSLVSALRSAGGELLLVARDGAVLRSTDQGRSFTVAAASRGLELAAAAQDGATLLAAGVRGIHHLGKAGVEQQ